MIASNGDLLWQLLTTVFGLFGPHQCQASLSWLAAIAYKHQYGFFLGILVFVGLILKARFSP